MGSGVFLLRTDRTRTAFLPVRIHARLDRRAGTGLPMEVRVAAAQHEIDLLQRFNQRPRRQSASLRVQEGRSVQAFQPGKKWESGRAAPRPTRLTTMWWWDLACLAPHGAWVRFTLGSEEDRNQTCERLIDLSGGLLRHCGSSERARSPAPLASARRAAVPSVAPPAPWSPPRASATHPEAARRRAAAPS